MDAFTHSDTCGPTATRPRASEWSGEKNACIDWTNPDDAIANGFTLLQLLEAHPVLAADLKTKKDETQTLKMLFLSGQKHQQKSEALQRWHTQGLLTLRDARWCRHCGRSGHTRLTCPLLQLPVTASDGGVQGDDASTLAERPPTGGRGGVLARFQAHQQHVERLKLLEEKRRRAESGRSGAAGAGGQGEYRSRRPMDTQANRGAPQRNRKELQLFSDERRRGVIERLEVEYSIGFVRVAEMGDVKFFVERVDYGVKEIAVGDAVTLKLDNSRDYSLAVDVRPEKPVVSLEDVLKFVARCRASRQPIRILSMLLSHQHDWGQVLRWTQVLESHDPEAYIRTVHSLVEMVTFIGNREPIHLSILQEFLTMAITPSKRLQQATAAAAGNEVAAECCFFPGIVQRALELRRLHPPPAALAPSSPFSSPSQSTVVAVVVEQWMEVAILIILARQYTTVTVAEIAPMQELLEGFFESQAPTMSAVYRCQMDAAVRKLRVAAQSRPAMSLIPSAEELSHPIPNPHSLFMAANLPVSGGVTYTSTERFVDDQCRLLRADTFEAVSRVMPAIFYDLGGYTPTEATLADVAHARVFHQVLYLGQVVTRDKDYAHPISYVLQVQPRSEKVSLRTQLHQGTAVCISTSLDTAVMSENELFWGIVTSCDATFMHFNIIVVTPCEGGGSFAQLMHNLSRNARLGKLSSSVLLETPIFMAGYTGIMRALGTFTGPLAVPLPLTHHIVGPQAVSDAADRDLGIGAGHQAGAKTHKLIGYIPPHCEAAFRELSESICSRFTLDEGQDAVMSNLPTSEVLLVQGPPGTGKSFIGCRVVEAYVRYKQLVASGDILQKVSVDHLTSTRPEDLLPHVGPVVVITYKNHALDEFLVDLLDSGLWDTPRPRVGHLIAAGASSFTGTTTAVADGYPNGRRLLRIGGRSKESRLAGYNLGALIHTITDKSAINTLKERIFVLSQRLGRLTKETQYLEAGRVPRSYFERWLSAEQRRSISFDDRDAWLRGERFTGLDAQEVQPSEDFLFLLRTQVAAVLAGAVSADGCGAAAAAGLDTAAEPSAPPADDNEDVSLSVFQEMRMEDESREFNNELHTSYLSAEAIHLATHPPIRPAAVPEELQSLWSLDPVTRHQYYAYLIQSAIALKARDCLTIMEAIRSIVSIRSHAIEEAKLSLMLGADVIGLTTTGCAMNQNLLRSLRPSVLVVEEAAEVLESQLLACMTDSLQQIVLIGDHYQLKPKVETFEYEKVNQLNLSLFERLARKISPICLTEQRRMHPTISALVRPFYDTQRLLDHPSLLTRPLLTSTGQGYVDSVPGLAKRVFFWRHSHPEEEAPGSRSKVNTREIRMVLQVVSHLVAEGVMQRSVTVITPYLGQCRMLRSVMRLSSLPDVRVSTVDLYQGDENDIVVLSLVRTEKLTEFIRMRNRLIVSCSRARFAMVIVGNDTLLRQSGHWRQVLESLGRSECVGDRLPVTHGTNPSKVTWMEVHGVTSAAVLERSLEGGTTGSTVTVGGGVKQLK